MDKSETWKIGDREFNSRLLLGTSRYPNPQLMFNSLAAAEVEIVTVSIRRLNLSQKKETFLNESAWEKYQILPNTAGCYTAKDAILTAELAREVLQTNWIKVEVIGDDYTLLPDPILLIRACEELVKKDFIVLPYCSDDPMLCRRLENIGCAAVMPLAAPIGSGLGIRNPHNLQIIAETVKVPVIVDAGIGTASDAALAMELGCSAVLLNTAVAEAMNPVTMAAAFKHAVIAGRFAYTSGRIPQIYHGQNSSPMEGRINT